MELEQLSDEAMNKLQLDMGMTPSRAEEDVKSLWNWINCQPHLPTLEDSDEIKQWLKNFLMSCKNRTEKAKRGLDHYFSSRSLAPELFTDRDPSEQEIVTSVKTLYFFSLPKLTPDGCRLHVFCHAVPDVSVYNTDAFMRRALMFLDWKIKEDVTCGDIFIFHLKYSTLAHLGKYNFATLSRFAATATHAYPLKIKAIHFTKAPSFVTYVTSNPFVPDKIKKRIKLHAGENVKELLPEIPPDCLPKEMGGTLDCSMEELNEAHHQRLLKLREWLMATANMKSDESKRPSEKKTNDLFGCDGSFRSLNID